MVNDHKLSPSYSKGSKMTIPTKLKYKLMKAVSL